MTIPHCPNPKCRYFHQKLPKKWFHRLGSHPNMTHGRVPRYRCKTCRKTFSDRTFSIDCWAHKRVDYQKLIEHLVTASGLNDLSRLMDISPQVIQNRFDRLGRNAIAFHSEALKAMPMAEDLTADGLESFSLSQYFPHHINVVAGSESEFIYTQGFANLRRKGRMTDQQKYYRQLLEARGKADPKAIEKSLKNLMEYIVQCTIRKGIKEVNLTTDEHKAYPRALAKITHPELKINHKQIPSTDPRTVDNPLFSANYIDRQLRKDMSDHVRETIQFAKCPSAMMMRMAIYRHYHNYVIPRRVEEDRKGHKTTHAEWAGLESIDWQNLKEKFWLKRVFLSKLTLGLEEYKTWVNGWRNPGVKMNRYLPQFVMV